MKIRTIKPEFWSSTRIAKLSRDARLLFIGLWNAADNGGRLLGSPKQIAGLLFPHDEDIGGPEVTRWLGELEASGFIVRYVVDGRAYISVPGFTEHQRVDERWPSRLPPPPGEHQRETGERPESVGEKSARLADYSARLGECFARLAEYFARLGEYQPLRIGIGIGIGIGIESGSEPEHSHTSRATESRTPERNQPEQGPTEASPEGRALLAERAKVVADGRRQRATRQAEAQAILGRPRNGEALLALPVTILPDGRVSAADPDFPGARPLRDVWRERYPQFDGRGTPRRRSLEEFVDALWSSSVTHAWDGTGSAYLARWATWLGTDAEKVRRAWEADGGVNAVDPERATAKRRWMERKGRGDDMPPFDTWFDQSWKRGFDRVDEAVTDDLLDFGAPTIGPRTGPPLGRGSGRPTPPTPTPAPHYDDSPETKAAAAAAFAAIRATTARGAT